MKNQMRMEGLTLTVNDVKRSSEFYSKKLGFKLEWNAAPHFAMVRASNGATIGLLCWAEAKKDGATKMNAKQKKSIHVELTTDNLDGIHNTLKSKGVKIHVAPHDEPWERSMTVLDPDGYHIEIAQGHRGKK